MQNALHCLWWDQLLANMGVVLPVIHRRAVGVDHVVYKRHLRRYMVNKIQGATGGNRQAHAPVVGRL